MSIDRRLAASAPVRLWQVFETHPVRTAFLVAIIVRLLLVAFSDLFEGFVLDDGTYHQMATDMASGDISHWDDFTYSLFWRTAAFLGPVTLLYELIDPQIVVGQLFVAVMGAIAVAVAVRLALEFLSPPWAVAIGLTLALLPSQAFWSAQLMKDASVWLALSALALAIAIANRSTGRRLLVAGVAVALLLTTLAFLREHTLVVAAWATMAAAFAGIAQDRFARIVGGVLLAVVIPWGVAAIGPGGLDLVMNAGSLEEIRFRMAQGANTAIVDTTPGGTEADLNKVILARKEVEAQIARLEEEVQTARSAASSSGASTSEGAGASERARERARRRAARLEAELAAARAKAALLLEQQSRVQAPPPGGQLSEDEATLDPDIAHLPRGLSVMLLEPFPIPFSGSASLRLARLESLIWYPLLALAAIGIWRARHHLRVLAFPIVAGAGILVMYALTEGNIGTAHRHRGEFVWVVALLAGLGASRASMWWSARKANPSEPTEVSGTSSAA